MKEKNNLEKIYDTFLEDLEPTEEMKKMYDKLINKIAEVKEHLNEEQIAELEELEDLFSNVNNLETKAAFFKGFSVATNIILEAKD